MKAFFFISVFLLFVHMAQAQNAKSHLKAGEQFLLNGLNDAALEEFDKAIFLDPNDGKAYYYKATVLIIKSDSSGAAENFQKAAVMDYNSEENFLSAAKIYYAINKKNEALNSINLGLESKSNSFDLLLLKTVIFVESGEYKKAFETSNEAIAAKDMAIAYYYCGLCAYKLGDIEEAENDLKLALIRDRKLTDAYLLLSEIQLEQQKYDFAIDNCGVVLLLLDPDNVRALTIRSKAFHSLHEPEPAIDDITKAIALDKNNWKLYLQRAKYNYDYALYTNAIDDLNLTINLNDTLIDAYLNRAFAFELLNNKADAIKDYSTIISLLQKKNLNDTRLLLAQDKLFELGKELNKPEIFINPELFSEQSEIEIKESQDSIILSGTIKDESELKEIKLNNIALNFNKTNAGIYSFSYVLPVNKVDYISISATDIYENISSVSYPVIYIETTPPIISLINPLPDNTKLIRLENGDNTLYIEGKVEDKSTIVEIKIDELNASFAPGDFNPRFTATINIQNRKNITISATDKFGNKSVITYDFSKEGFILSADNPMGKTWVVIVENSEYQEFYTLRNPKTDVNKIELALNRYQISKILHMNNMSKREMERFFAIDLRDLIVSNKVNSLLIWYAGHGQFLNNTGYWVPIDGRLNDEYSYYNVNALKASLYSYSSLSHILVVSDACAAGESFTLAMRGDNSEISCDNVTLMKQKSALVLTSSYSEPAEDNSLFAQTFTNALINNPTDCISIDEIAGQISSILYKYTAQKPTFGRISGLENNNGTFFFIAK